MKRRTFLTSSLLFSAGCSAPILNSTIGGKSSEARPEKLRLAVTDIKGLEQLKADYEPFRQELEKTLGLPIHFFPVRDLLASAPALLSGKVDLVFAGPSEYLILRARAEAVPIVSVTRPNYYSVVAVEANSTIQSLADLKGKTIAMRTEGSTASHIGTTKLLLDAGLNAENFQVEMLEDGGLEALLNGKVDAWADASARYTRFVEAAAAGNQVRIIARGQALPNDVFVVRGTLAPEFIQAIQTEMVNAQTKLLSAMASTPGNRKYQQSNFVLAADMQYDELRKVYKAVGLESVIR